ncbi:MAG: hypothetical protein Ct9H90mP15_09450 [Candidatus Neomarinimicrobiota bacterium]|nr:MAG: hypothetical protein Ct9H90mP15_09450 [Candidatus Neomarinimicrobiota bacterium]
MRPKNLTKQAGEDQDIENPLKKAIRLSPLPMDFSL